MGRLVCQSYTAVRTVATGSDHQLGGESIVGGHTMLRLFGRTPHALVTRGHPLTADIQWLVHKPCFVEHCGKP